MVGAALRAGASSGERTALLRVPSESEAPHLDFASSPPRPSHRGGGSPAHRASGGSRVGVPNSGPGVRGLGLALGAREGRHASEVEQGEGARKALLLAWRRPLWLPGTASSAARPPCY